MKSFHFRAERLLEWRRIQADAARVAFMRANESARETARLVEAAEARRQQAEREYCGVMTRTVEAGSLERYRNWIAARQRDVMARRQSHQQRMAALEKAVEGMRQADRNKRVIERLRDRAWHRYLEASRRVEMKELDALATLRFTRRKAEGGSTHER